MEDKAQEFEVICPQCVNTIYYTSFEDNYIDVECMCGWRSIFVNGEEV